MALTQVLEKENLTMTPNAERIIKELEVIKNRALQEGQNPVFSMLNYWGQYIVSPSYVTKFNVDDKEFVINYINEEKLKICNNYPFC